MKHEKTHENIPRQTHMWTNLAFSWQKWSYCCCRGGSCPAAPGSWPARLLWTNIWSPLLLLAAAAAVAAAAAAQRFSSSEMLGERPSMRLGRFLWSYLPGKSERVPSGLGKISRVLGTVLILAEINVLARATPTSWEHKEVIDPTLTHGGGCLDGDPFVLIINNDDLPWSVFLTRLWVKYGQLILGHL